MFCIKSVSLRRLTLASGAVAALAGSAAAQERQFNDDEPIPSVQPRRGFSLFGLGDFAVTGMRNAGQVDWWTGNASPVPASASPSYASLPNHTAGAFFFELQYWIASARSDWLKFRDLAPSLENALGGGYNVRMNFQRWMPDVAWAYTGKDGSLGTLHSGATSERGTGTCLDNGTRTNAFVAAGIPLLAASDCPPTWPNPEAGFDGERVVADTTWLRRFNENPAGFTFDEHGIPREERVDKLYGSFQTYGSVVDYGREILQRFGAVVPNGSGAPLMEGYPMGIEFAFQAFTYSVPALSNVFWYKTYIINNSAEVYGVGLDYDSLYMGTMHRPAFLSQSSGMYAVPELGAIFNVNPNINQQNCYGGVHGANVTGGYTAGTNIRGCLSNGSGSRGFLGGAIVNIYLKSPIGDLRNKKFTDPESPFYFPGHPNAGDTITFNQANTCGFSCAQDQFFTYNARGAFGAYAHIAEDALGGRGVTSGQLTELQYFDLFHNQDWPVRWSPGTGKVGSFNWYVPGSAPDGSAMWDYNHDGIADTLFVTSCWQQGCVPRWTDTLPGGFPNRVHNAVHQGFGPFKLAAGDTAEWVQAYAMEGDSISIERVTQNILDTYLNFWLSAEPPALPNILTAAVTGGNRQFDTFIRMYLDESINAQTDPFLLAQATQLREATDPASVALKVFNPTLVNEIRARALPFGTSLVDTVPRDTSAAAVAACAPGSFDPALCQIVTGEATGVVDTVFVFKSCDNGLTFTNTSAFACTPAPARSVDGSQPGFAWQAYTVLTRGSNGLFPTQITDGGIVGGLTYTYVIAAKSQPAIFKVVTPRGGTMVTDSLVIRPAVANGLSTNTSNRNVAVIYVPASRQAGGQSSQVQLLGANADTVAAVALSFRLSKQIRGNTPIDVDLVFSDSATIEVFDSNVATPAVDSTRVTLFDLNTSGASSARKVVSQQSYVVTDSSFTVDPAGLFLVSDSSDLGTFNKRTYVFKGTGTQVTMLANGKPFFVTDSLNTSQITPNRTLIRNDYNGLVTFLTASDAGEINNGATVWIAPGLGPLSGNSEPNLQWRPNQSEQTFNRLTNHYRITFSGKEYGPGSPFTLNFTDRAAVQAALDASLNARSTADQTVTTDAAATAINEALGTSLTSADLLALDLPFTVVNATTGNPVQVAVRSGKHSSTILLGSSNDTMTVAVPTNKWIPGDELIFIEEVRRLAQTATGRDTIVLSGGVADSVSLTQVTWEEVTIGCDVPSGAFTCNPVVGLGGTGYTAVGANYVHNVVYYQPLGNLLNVDLSISPDLSGDQITGVTEADLDLVFVVPNPYIMFSQYEQIQGVKRLLFTGLPPQGTIRIYTASGQFVQQLMWTDADLERNCTMTVNTTDCQSTGDLPWNLRTREDLEIGPGFYVFVVSTDVGGSKREKIGKFVIIH